MTAVLHVEGTVPYPWPFDGCLDGRRLALVICGAQRALVAVSSGAASAAERLEQAAGAVRSAHGTVVWVRHGAPRPPSRPTAWLPVRETVGWQLATTPDPEDDVVDAAGWDGCFGSDLYQRLRAGGRRTVALGGYASELTVDSTVRTLNDRGIECLVLTDAGAPVDPALGARAHHSLTMSGGIFGALGTTDALCAALALLRPVPAGMAGTAKESSR